MEQGNKGIRRMVCHYFPHLSRLRKRKRYHIRLELAELDFGGGEVQEDQPPSSSILVSYIGGKRGVSRIPGILKEYRELVS